MDDRIEGGRLPGPSRSRRLARNRGTAFAAGLSLAALLAGTSAAEPSEAPRLDEDVQVLVDHLGARTVDCPAELLAPDVVDRTYCGKIDLEFKPLRKAVLKFLHKNRDVDAVQLEEWSTLNGGLRATPLLLGSLVLRLVYDPQTSTLLLIPHGGCLEDSGTLAPGLFEWVGEDLVEPERLEFPVPEFPERARTFRVEGVVVLQAIVKKNGTTGQHCVIHAEPRGYGFVASAMSALKRSRYKPATLDGEPVDIVVTVASRFFFGR
jgi:hypothetical protein